MFVSEKIYSCSVLPFLQKSWLQEMDLINRLYFSISRHNQQQYFLSSSSRFINIQTCGIDHFPQFYKEICHNHALFCLINDLLICNNIIKGKMDKKYDEILLQSAPAPPTSQLRKKIKENQIKITSYSNSIRKKRAQMKLFSEEMTKLIEKKLIPKNQSQYLHPKFNPQFSNPQLQQLHNERQSIYNQISKLRQTISEMSSHQQPQIKNQIHKKQGMLQNVIKQEQRISKEKSMLEQQLNKNKEVLLYYKDSQCIREIQQNQNLMDDIKKQTRDIQRDIKNLVNQQINISLYTSQVQQQIQSMDHQSQIQDQIDRKEIEQVVQDIRNIMEDKRIAERQFQAKKEDLFRKIRQTIEQNSKIQQDIKKVTTKQLKMQLQRKKKQLGKYQSTPHISYKDHSPSKKNRIIQKQKINGKQTQNQAPSLILAQPPLKEKSKQMKKNQKKQKMQSIVYIGEWRQENLIKDDIIESKNISRAISIKIRTRDNKITGIGVTYIDSIGVQVLGRSNIWKNSQDKLQQGEQEYFIDLQDIVSIYYYSPSSNLVTSNNIPASNNISAIGLKFKTKSSKPVVKIGEFLDSEEFQHINLQNQFIKTIEFTLDSNYKLISGIKLALVSAAPSQTKKSLESEHEQENFDNIEMPNKITDSLMPSRWLSTSSEADLSQRKVFVKKLTPNRKLNDIPQVDHRLMLNRKKKMV